MVLEQDPFSVWVNSRKICGLPSLMRVESESPKQKGIGQSVARHIKELNCSVNRDNVLESIGETQDGSTITFSTRKEISIG